VLCDYIALHSLRRVQKVDIINSYSLAYVSTAITYARSDKKLCDVYTWPPVTLSMLLDAEPPSEAGTVIREGGNEGHAPPQLEVSPLVPQ